MPLPTWAGPAAAGASVVVLLGMALIARPMSYQDISVAFVGNSMQYYNDFPRFIEELSDHHLTQNSCLHGDATLVNLLETGNGMYEKWRTANALVEGFESEEIYDYGACSVHQLLFGYDSRFYEGQDDDTFVDENDDGRNPCLEDENYLPYLEKYFTLNPPEYDFIVLNDNTRSPARNSSRQQSLAKLKSTYVQWFNWTGATPVFISTHAYWTQWRNMSGLVDVPTFTSLTYEGYLQYAAVLKKGLPKRQAPRIAPVGLAFLMVWEENYSMWEKLFHADEVHASPHGTFLQGVVVHYTLFGRMPTSAVALRDSMSRLWLRARRMQPATHRTNPMPTRQEAEYLYRVAERVVRYGQTPKSFIRYRNGESAPD